MSEQKKRPTMVLIGIVALAAFLAAFIAAIFRH
jgi:hypothetical protein